MAITINKKPSVAKKPAPAKAKAKPASKSKAASKTAAPPPKKAKRNVLVRMYNVGFGDCFLVEFPAAGNQVTRVLIDCGSIATAGIAMPDVVSTILHDTEDSDGLSRIDVVVCTHRHADHVSGFANAAWKDLQVKEVWFPWTEDPKDSLAKDIRETQSKLALALESHWRAKVAIDRGNEDSTPWLSLAVNALSNQSAMTMLHEGFKCKPKRLFLSSDGSPTLVESAALPNITTYVLGPSKSKDVIRDMDPPAGTTYLRQTLASSGGAEAFEPFGDSWPIEPADYESRWPTLAVNDREKTAMKSASAEWDPAITVALESAVNGTSLVLAFEIEGTLLLFPGDAQWGTWNAMLSDPVTVQLLSKTSFWKVGHHGSHNATPKAFVSDTAPAYCCAMMSTKKGKWDSIPRPGLIKAISDKGIALARSDEPPEVTFRPFSRNDPLKIDVKIKVG